MKRKWPAAAAMLLALVLGGLWISLAAGKNGEKGGDGMRELHLGMFLESPVTFSSGETMEDNRFLDWIQEDLNIRVTYDWIYSKDEFLRNIDLYIACDMLPDALMVEEKQYRQMLEYGLLQPVTEIYQNLASDQLKAYVESMGSQGLEAVTEEGEMMAIPFPSLTASGINLMWIRQDWLDELGLDVPSTVEQIGMTARTFVEQDTGGEGTIGILGPGLDQSLTGVGKCTMGFQPIFTAFGAYPKYWILDAKGRPVYGSVQQPAKQALSVLAEWYEEGILDQEFFSRENIQEVLDQGKVGIFFGPWWSAEKLERDMVQNGSVWKAYPAPVNETGGYTCTMPSPVNQYLVIHKGCHTPEAVVEILNYGITHQDQWMMEGRMEGIEMKAYPLGWECDFADELEYTYGVLKERMEGQFSSVDFTGHKVLKRDLESLDALNRPPLDEFGLEDWNPEADSGFIRLYGIINGVGAVAETDYTPVYSVFTGETKTMRYRWKELEQLEEETYARIIMGQESPEAFDEFAREWEEKGGREITGEVAAALLE